MKEFDSAEFSDLVGGSGTGLIHTDSLYLGCFYQNYTLFDTNIGGFTIPDTTSGADSIIACHAYAVADNRFYFGLRNGNICIVSLEHSAYDAMGPSTQCNLPCGSDTVNKGAICGGLAETSWYQVEVRQ